MLHPKEKALIKREIIKLPSGKLLSVNDLSALFKKLHRGVYKDKETFCIEGERCNKIAFIVSGYMYSSYRLENGNENTTSLFFTPLCRIVCDYYSLKSKGVSTGTIRAVKKVILIWMYITDLEALFDTNPAFKDIARLLVDKCYNEKIVSVEVFRRMGNEEKIREFFRMFPKLYGKYSNIIIGSFLGVDRREVSFIYALIP